MKRNKFIIRLSDGRDTYEDGVLELEQPIKKYEPGLDVSNFYHDIGTEDYLSYIEK